MHQTQAKRLSRRTRPIAAIVALLPLLGSPLMAQEVVAALSSDKEPYRRAYESFQAAFGKAVPILPLEGNVHLSKQTKVVVAFGTKAAGKRYPDRATLIYCIAPGLEVDPDLHDGKSIRIPMEPQAAALLASLIKIQPTLKKLAILWSSAALESSARTLEAAGRAMSVAVASERLDDPAELPATLRRLNGKVDALWLPADPLLINAQNFETIKQYAYHTGIPLYVPTEGLAEGGALAAVSISYKEIGETAARAAKKVLAGADVSADAYAQRSEISINLTAIKATAIGVPADAIKKADRVFP